MSQSSPQNPSQSEQSAREEVAGVDVPVSSETLIAFTEGLLEGCIVLSNQNQVLHVNGRATEYLKSLGQKVEASADGPAEPAMVPPHASLDDLVPENWMPEFEKAFQLPAHDLPSFVSHRPVYSETGLINWRLRFSTDGSVRCLYFRPGQESRDENEQVRELEAELAELRSTMELSQELLHNSNERLNESVEKQQEMYARLVDSSRMRSEFLANTSHELRTPLGAIIGFLQIIMDDLCEDDQEHDRFIQNAFESANHLLTLINDILDMAKIESGALDVSVEPVDVEDLLDKLEGMLGAQAFKKGIELNFEIDETTAGSVMADPSRLLQVLINLVGNSIKFTEKGSITVSFTPYPDDPEIMVFSVDDTGIGIAAADHDRIFEQFAQVDGSATRQAGGTGLGLAICKTLVELMQGQIWLVQSRKGIGTKISLSLPSAACNSAMKPGVIQKEGEEVLPLDF